jgi:NAD(P)-dependent dehydrogenase (short-subunit alcohol dehydrogenase family)
MVNYEQTVCESGNSNGRLQRHRRWDCIGVGGCGRTSAVNYSSDRQGAERVAKAIIDSGGEAISVGADVSQAANVARLFDKVDSAFGRVDVLVNNAGVFRFAAFTEITEESFHLHYNINVLGTLKERIVREVGYGFGSKERQPPISSKQCKPKLSLSLGRESHERLGEHFVFPVI